MAGKLSVSAAVGLRNVVLAVAGEMDAVTVPQFQDALLQQAPAARGWWWICRGCS